MRVTAGSGDRESMEWRCPRGTDVATNSTLEHGCPRVPRWGCPLIPALSTFPGHGCPCVLIPHATKAGCPHIPATSSPLTVAVLTPWGTAVPVSHHPHIPAHPGTTIPMIHPSIPVSQLSPRPSQGITVPCPAISLSPNLTHPHLLVPPVPACPARPVSPVHRPRRPLASSQSKTKLSLLRPCPHGQGMNRGVPVTANLPAPVAVLGSSRPVPE